MMALRALQELAPLAPSSIAMFAYLLSLEHTRPTPTSRPLQINKACFNSILTGTDFQLRDLGQGTERARVEGKELTWETVTSALLRQKMSSSSLKIILYHFMAQFYFLATPKKCHSLLFPPRQLTISFDL